MIRKDFGWNDELQAAFGELAAGYEDA